MAKIFFGASVMCTLAGVAFMVLTREPVLGLVMVLTGAVGVFVFDPKREGP